MNRYIIILLLIAMAPACKKQVEASEPETNPTRASVYTDDATAASVVTYIYARMGGGNPTGATQANSFAQGRESINYLAGLSADELKINANVTNNYRFIYSNSNRATFNNLWRDLYQFIYITNAVIEGIEQSTGGMTDAVKKQLTGEAKFMRAFLHFYLTNLWGSVPYIRTTNSEVNMIAQKMTTQEVYNNILTDLLEAKSLLPDNYVTPTGATSVERVRPNKWTATAFLARIYLYMGQWANAENEATLVIANTARFNLVTDITKVFYKDSKEVIWNIPPVVIGFGTPEGNTFQLVAPPNPTNTPATLRNEFQNNFESTDKRRTFWIDSPVLGGVKYYVPGKYKIRTIPTNVTPIPTSNEYLVVFRLAEQFLIRAEARAQLSKITDAGSDLTQVRTRAGLLASGAGDQTSMLLAIERERQVELFAEWGHRWLDLKRTNRVDAVMTAVAPSKNTTWNTNMKLYPIPVTEISLNPNLSPQNPGYN